MKLSYDLHIHSALSPCSDDEMTPNNIINMAHIKGLDIIAVTDHNSAENLRAASECASERGILFVPGMELETAEEIHVVCYFPDVHTALCMQRVVYDALPPLKNRSDIFGRQLVFNCRDEVIAEFDRLLLTATSLSINEVFKHVEMLGGVVVPAHIDRKSYSILTNLGAIPKELPFKYLEVSRGFELENIDQKLPGVEGYRYLKSSDAHNLGDISEVENFIDLKDKSVTCLIDKLRGLDF